jgi:hypothetical protein
VLEKRGLIIWLWRGWRKTNRGRLVADMQRDIPSIESIAEDL